MTQQTNVPLNQSTDDGINNVLPYFVSHGVVEGSISSLTDATSSDLPIGDVIVGPDNELVGIAWNFGTPDPGMVWQLDRVDIWIAGYDNFRKGFHGDLSYSLSGDVNDFTVIPSSEHLDSLSENANYNHIRYDFPAELVTDFQYIRLNLLNSENKPRIVEVDMWVSQIPEPGTFALFAGGMALLGGYFLRRRRH